jgi:6-phosphogluconolactonase/glucosamine-6-phosphate isomerase/deaminase
MRYATARLRRAATRLLAHEVGRDPPTAEALAVASGRLFDRLSDRLAKVIGPVGVQAIFLRAAKLLKAEFVFLDERIVPRERGDSPAESLRQCLREQKPEVIQEVSVILFATFAGLLVTVIGDRLSWSLLQQIWPDTLLPEAEFQEAEE